MVLAPFMVAALAAAIVKTALLVNLSLDLSSGGFVNLFALMQLLGEVEGFTAAALQAASAGVVIAHQL